VTANPYAKSANADTFDPLLWLARVDPRLAQYKFSESRRVATRYDPMLFAYLYLRPHLKSPETDNKVTWSDAHLEWFRQAKHWTTADGRPPGELRDAYVAPRGTGKSTFFFLLLPMWAAAHGHTQFVAAFADSATQAQTHLATFKKELETNELLQLDYPELCTPAKRSRGVTVSDNVGMAQQKNGFVFAARGVDSGSLGTKVGNLRPDLILLDDVEPDESNYSEHQMLKRLTTLRDTILPLNIFARVVLVGTVTMPGSIVHQLVQHGRGEQEFGWVKEEKFRIHHALPIVQDEYGTERSAWPAKWPLDFLESIRNTRQYAKNYLNAPYPDDGSYWTPDDITLGDTDEYGTTLISIDPATTSNSKSDYTGIAVVSRSLEPEVDLGSKKHRCYVRHAEKLRLQPKQLRERVMELLEVYPEIGLVLIETNQGGDTWLEVLHGLPVKIKTIHQKEKKEVRAQRALNFYQRDQVKHTRTFNQLDEELLVFPRGMNDDLVDAVGTAVSVLLRPVKRKPKVTAVSRFAA
jgi:phage terminase large subunit-like protein